MTTFAIREELARKFLDAADEIAGVEARATAAQQKLQREKMKSKLGRIVDDYERELEPLVQAIGLLPAENGGKFEVKHADFRTSSVSMNVQVIYTKGGHKNIFELDAMTTVEGRDTFGLKVEPAPEGLKNDASATFETVRNHFAHWFATVAPERLPELQDIMIPDRSVALDRDMKASSPLRLKPHN